ncbi:MAG: DUF2179 domain-containing protein [Balneola sp.]
MFSLIPPILIPVIIFFARIMDVSLGTLRIVMVSRGYKYKAALLGFFEVLIESLKEAGFTITSIAAEGGFGPVNIIFTVLKRRRWSEVVSIIEKIDPAAFYSSEDVKYANSSLDLNKLDSDRGATNRLLGLRKGI